MKTLAIMFFSAVVGWFLCVAVISLFERIFDWRKPALLAALGILAVVVLLFLP